MDYFKVVSTKEKRGIYFTVVPHQWEVDGVLWWPEHLPHSSREQLLSKTATAPEEKWIQYPCFLKCSGIINFKEALRVEKELTQCIDTDAEALFTEMGRKKRPIKKSNQQLTDRNYLFDECAIENQEDNESARLEPVPNIIIETVGSELESNNSPADTLYTATIWEDMRTIKQEIEEIKTNFNALKEEIKENYSKINVSLDKNFRILSSQEPMHKEQAVAPPKEDLLANIQFPLGSCEELIELETKIRNNVELRTQFIKSLTKVGGCSGEEVDCKVGYKVVNHMFTSKVLTQYSWTGVSRGSSEGKKSLQILDGIVGVLFEVIYLADNRYIRQKNIAFLKDAVLKHAKKRMCRKRKASTSASTSSANIVAPDDVAVDEQIDDQNNVEPNGENV
jgi:hypothetical protein